MPKRKRWSELTLPQRIATVVLALGQLALITAAQVDIGRRPADQIRGSKRMWRMLALGNYVGPIAYFAIGIRR
jgi:hypothetical protein